MSKNPEQTDDGKYRGVIYEYHNKNTGKSYVGKTDNEPIRRQSWHNKGCKSYGGKKIMEARKQYGVDQDAWDYHVLEEVFSDTQDDLNATLKSRETYWIKEKDSVENGYNGSYGDGNKGIKFSPERAKRCGDSMRNKHHTDETKAKISAAGLGRVVPGPIRSRISQKLRGKKRTAEQRKAQSDRMKGIVPKAATEGARRWRERNGGGSWKGKKIPPSGRANMKKAQQARGTDTIATWPNGREETFPTMLDASKATGVAVGSIHYSMTNNTKTKDGYKFRKAS